MQVEFKKFEKLFALLSSAPIYTIIEGIRPRPWGCGKTEESCMNDQIRQIAGRIRELREILEVDAEELAGRVNVSPEVYQSYENAEADIPIGVIYGVAEALGVDPTVLLTGDAPRMSDYTIVRGGKGVSVERYDGYKFSSLAFNYIGRMFDPMIVDLEPMEKGPELVVHGGQEFNYVIE